MPHYYVKPEDIQGDRCVITGSEVRHIVTVRRAEPGSEIRVFDGTGRTCRVRIDTIGKDEITGTVIEEEFSEPSPVGITLYHSVPKGDRFDWLVEKAAELGVRKIVPLVTARSVLREIPAAKVDRWRRLSQAACQQCRRADLLEIAEPVRIESAVSALPSGSLHLIPWEAEDARTVEEAFRAAEPAAGVDIFIGPEGGFSVGEIQAATAAGLVPVTLGPRILRVETAGLLASILVLNLAGEFGRPQKN